MYDIICGKEGCDITQAEAISNLLDVSRLLNFSKISCNLLRQKIKLSRQTINKEASQRQVKSFVDNLKSHILKFCLKASR